MRFKLNKVEKKSIYFDWIHFKNFLNFLRIFSLKNNLVSEARSK